MKISSAKAVLTEEDILSIINDYVKVDGLTFESIEIEDFINIKGSYKKGVAIPFKAVVGVGNVHDNKIIIKILNINVAKVGVFGGIKNFALKTFLKDFEQYGIKASKDYLEIDVNLIAKLIPYVYFNLNSVKIVNNAIEAEVSDIIYAENKETIKIEKKNAKLCGAVKDSYSKLRSDIQEKVPDKYEKIVEYAMLIPDITALLIRLLRDKRVNVKVKVKIAGVIAYLASPIDILPDFIPFIGSIDDTAVAFFGLNSIMNEVPEEIILDNWQGDKDIIKMIGEGVKYISNAVGAQNVSKLIEYIKYIGKGKKEESDEVV